MSFEDYEDYLRVTHALQIILRSPVTADMPHTAGVVLTMSLLFGLPCKYTGIDLSRSPAAENVSRSSAGVKDETPTTPPKDAGAASASFEPT